jgi:glucose-1-phosphate thymidylyltransferase
MDDQGNPLSIAEKPLSPKSKFAVPGIYFYPSGVVDMAKSLSPSARGELEITDLNLRYLEKGSLKCCILGRGTMWFDTGTIKSLNDASNFLRVLEERQGVKVGVPEEIGLRNNYLSFETLKASLMSYPENEYRHYLEDLF